MGKSFKESQGSRVQLTDQSIGTYSDTIDLRLNWEQITKVVTTNEVIALFGTDPQCIVISKQTLSEEEIQQVDKKIEGCFSGTIVRL
ncbi:YcxB family protein [Enterococcus sp. AZ072]|uniref:YcxB family protein n=1 Tax=unclassified Enterococcus TaxID=2608891 RepID=UPI003D2DC38B